MTDSQTPTPQMIFLPTPKPYESQLPMLQLWHALSGGQKPAQKPAEPKPEVKLFGVFEHSSGRQGGFVVRSIYDGWTPAPYTSVDAVQVFKRESSAQHYADKLNN